MTHGTKDWVRVVQIRKSAQQFSQQFNINHDFSKFKLKYEPDPTPEFTILPELIGVWENLRKELNELEGSDKPYEQTGEPGFILGGRD